MTRIVLVRHGITPLNEQSRYQGVLDADLSAAGVAQAHALRGRLQNLVDRLPGPVAVHSSDRLRALRTAALALPGRRAHVTPALRELDFGEFDGRTYEDNLARFGADFTAWIDRPDQVTPRGGESLSALTARTLGWTESLPRTGSVVAFTHGGPIRALLAAARGVAFTRITSSVEPCAIIVLDRNRVLSADACVP